MKYSIFLLTSIVIVSGCSQPVKTTRIEVHGPAMEPNIYDGQILEVETLEITKLARGDVLYFEFDGATWIKRLIGLPGEKVEIQGGNIFINDQLLEEAYKVVSPKYDYGPILLKENEYFVLGDDRNRSKDSHSWGPISGDDILGRVVLDD